MIFEIIVYFNDICDMIAVIKGDIANSRNLSDQNKWLLPLKDLFERFGKSPHQWEIVWGDFFQIELFDPYLALKTAFEIRAIVKSIVPEDSDKNISPIDVRIAIGIGKKEYSGERISESNGEAFVFAGEQFERLKKSKAMIAIKSPWTDFDEEINLCLKLASVFMNKWSISSAELIKFILRNPKSTQKKIGDSLGIKQNSVSGRWNRANTDELLELEQFYENRLGGKLI